MSRERRRLGVRQKARTDSARKPKNEKDVKTISSSKRGVEFYKHCKTYYKAKISCSDKKTLFEVTLDRLCIQHKCIKPFTPRHNGKVERSHRKDNECFYADHKFFSFDDFQKQLAAGTESTTISPCVPSAGSHLNRLFLLFLTL
ncbi:MAG: integrase core domain-containing protein [Oscillospiraceae bacterium]